MDNVCSPATHSECFLVGSFQLATKEREHSSYIGNKVTLITRLSVKLAFQFGINKLRKHHSNGSHVG